MSGKARLTLLVSTVMLLGLAVLAWPINLRVLPVASKYTTAQVSSYESMGQGSAYEQKLSLEGEYLEEFGIWLDSIAPEQSGSLQIELRNRSKQEIFSRIVPLSEMKNGTFNRIKIGKSITQGQYTVQIKALDCGQGSFRLGLIRKRNGKSKAAINYRGRKAMNGIQKLMYWLLLGELWLLIWKLFRSYKPGRIRTMIDENRGQAAVILGVISLFCLSAALSPAVTCEKPWRAFWPCFLNLGFFIALVVSRRHHTALWQLRQGKKQLPLILLLLLSAAVRIPMLGTMQRWDAGEYYYRLGTACRNYQYSLQSLLDNFRLCSHSNLGFSLIAAIGEFLSPGNSIGVLIVSLVLTLLAIACLYYLLRDAWMKCSSWLAAGFALAISFTPIFLGTFAYVNPDYFLAVYFIFLLYSDYRKWNILAFASAVLVSQCKETGILVVAGFYGLKMAADFAASRGGIRKRVEGVLNGSSVWIALAAGAVYEALVFRLGSFTTWSQNGAAQGPLWSNTGTNCFGFNADHIAQKLRQFFCANFAWLISAVVICSAAAALFRRFCRSAERREKRDASKYFGLIGAMLGFALFCLLYITSCLNRYNILFAVGWSITGVLAYYRLAGRGQRRLLNVSVISLLSCLFCVQAFWNIDAVSSKVFETCQISGRNTMLNTLHEEDMGFYGDGFVNNYQYAWMDQALNKLLRKIDYDSAQAFFLPSEVSGGIFVSGNVGVYNIAWDKVRQKRVFERGNANEVPIRIWREADAVEDLPEKICIPLIRYYHVDEDRVRRFLEPLYDFGERESVKSYGGEIEYYQAVRKDSD